MESPELADVELRILAREEGRHPVELTLDMQQEFERGWLDPATMPPRASLTDAESGRALLQWLLADAGVRSAWSEIKGRFPRRRLRLRIDPSAPELHALPWELLRDELGGVGRDLAASADTPFSRYLAGQWRPGAPVLERPIRILVAVADPKALAAAGAEIDRAAEIERIKEVTSKQGIPITLQVLDGPCTLTRLEEALRAGCHVLHFVGHGVFSQGANEGRLLLSDEADPDKIRQVSETEVADLFGRLIPAAGGGGAASPIRLVTLLSCQTASRSPGDAFRGIAPRLVAAGVPAVVAMQDVVPRPTAYAFMETFYPRLLEHGYVDLAMNEARSALIAGRLPPGAHDALAAHAIPCLFMRLREGRLLGTRGRLSSTSVEKSFWPFLLDNIKRGRCIPFLGPHLSHGLLPSPSEVARRLADHYEYPLDDKDDLVRVAQYISLNDPGLLRARYVEQLGRGLYAHLGRVPTEEEESRLETTNLVELVEQLKWAEAALEKHETTVYHQLAELELPIYISTAPHPLLEAALARRGKAARSMEPRWEAEAGSPQWLIEPPPDRKSPVVFHLNGLAGDETQIEHLVLTEDDYLAHLVHLARDQEVLLPMNLMKALATGAFLFLGYDVTDWSFRVVLQGLLKSIAHTGKRMFVGVQLAIDDAARRDRAQEFLRGYLGQYQIEIYWGTTQQLVADLSDRWRGFQKGVK